MDKPILEVGDLLLRGKEIGVVKHANDTPYGVCYVIHWTWSVDNSHGITTIPDLLLCEGFFDRFTVIKGGKG